MANIGKLAGKLTIGTGAFETGLKTATGVVSSFAQKADSLASKVQQVDFSAPAKSIEGFQSILSLVPGPLGQIGASVLGIGGAILSWVIGVSKAKQAAESLFQEIGRGQLTTAQAFDRARVDDTTAALTEFREALQITTAIEQSSSGAMAAQLGLTSSQQIREGLNNTLREIQAGRGPIEQALRGLFESPGGREFIAEQNLARARNGMRDLRRELGLQSAQVGMSANAQRRLQMAYDFAARSGISLAEAQRVLRRELADVSASQAHLSSLQNLARLNQDIEQTAQAYRDQATAVTMSAGALQIYQLEQRGASEQDLARLRQLQALAEGAQMMRDLELPTTTYSRELGRLRDLLDRGAISQDAFNRAARRARDAFDQAGGIEQLRTPFQRFARSVADINRRFADGILSVDQYARAVAGAVQELERAHTLSAIQSPQALTRGSAEAQSAITRFERDLERGRESPQDRVRRVLEQSVEIERRQLETQRQIADALRGQQQQVVNIGP